LSILIAKNVSKKYEGQEVLHNVSLELDKGEILAIIGRSGSGKSTLIRALAGLLDIEAGEISFHGEILEGPEDRLVAGYEEIRLVHQDFKLKHKMTVRENIRYELLAYVKDYQEERIETLLKLCKIEHLADQDIAMVSGGEKQRVAIARAMATEPEILLMDEPFSNLDINTKNIFLEEIRQIVDETETSVILITHDSRDALAVADRIIVLANGKQLQSGSPKELYNHPAKKEVADLLGQYNLLSADLISKICGIKSSSDSSAVWSENVVLGSGAIEGDVIQTIFHGSYSTVIMNYEGAQIRAIDTSKSIQKGDKVNFQINPDHLFNFTED